MAGRSRVDPRARWALVGLVVTFVAGLLLNAFLGLSWAFDCFDGDGGFPFVAPDSPQGQLCRAGGGLAGWLIPASWLFATAVPVLLLKRWRRVRGDIGPFWLSLVVPLVVPIAVYSALSAPSDDCSGVQPSLVWGCRRY